MLDGKTVTPLYRQLMERIQEDISLGILRPGDRLMSEIEMSKAHKVSVITVRKALDELASQGIVEKKQGKGTFVTMTKYRREMSQLLSFTQSCRLIGAQAGAKILQQDLIAGDASVCRSLGLEPGEHLVRVSRLRYVNQEPMAIETTCFSLRYRFLLEEDLNDNSMLDILYQRTGERVGKSDKTIEITRAGAQEARDLGLRRNEPLLSIRSVAYNTEGKPLFAGVQLINGERFKLHIV